MKTADSLKASLDVSLATEQGDIEIADDFMKSSVFLLALATAAIYFAFNQLAQGTHNLTTLKGMTILSICLLTVSVLLVPKVHLYYMQFRATCRHMIVARKSIHEELIDKIEELNKVTSLAETPLWALLESGQISNHIPTIMGSSIITVREKQVFFRERLDNTIRWQRSATTLGFLLLIVSGVLRSLPFSS